MGLSLTFCHYKKLQQFLANEQRNCFDIVTQVQSHWCTSNRHLIQDLTHEPFPLLPDTHWARRCWPPAPPDTTDALGSLKRSTQPCPVAHRSLARVLAVPRGCVRPGCTGSSWTGRSACHSHWAYATATELSGPQHAGMSLLSCRSLGEEEQDIVRVNYRKLLLVSTHTEQESCKCVW